MPPPEPKLKPKTEQAATAVPSTPAVAPAVSGQKGCAPSFLTDKSGELNEACELTPSQKKEEYVQPEAEKEAGGEG